MPALFIGHGNPMLALSDNQHSQAWRDKIKDMPRPRAILCISAHWLTRGIAVSAAAQPETLHDFSGFPAALNAIRYAAPGEPQLARKLAPLLAPYEFTLDAERGLDHGVWSVLKHLYPAADIPVLQLSLDVEKTEAEHYAVAAKLRPLRDEGVLILGSGNIVHNLGRMNWQQPDGAYDWATRFNQRIQQNLLARDHAALFKLNDDDAKLAVPTPEHYWPLLYVAAQQAADETLELFNDRFEFGSIGMQCCLVGGSVKDPL